MADKANDLIVGLDIGSSKIVCAIASPLNSTSFRIEGIGQSPSMGIRLGSVSEINQAVESIRTAVEEAERSAQITVKSVAAGISGVHIVAENQDAMVAIHQKEVTQADMDNLISNVQASSLPPSMRYLSIIPREYAVDSVWGHKTPLGLEANRLDGRLHVVTAASNPCLNLNKAIRRSGLEFVGNQLSFNPLSTANAILTPEEKRLGVCLIDIGAELADVAVFYDDAIQFSSVFPIGGKDITNEVAIKTKLSAELAEQLKLEMGMSRFDPQRDTDTSIKLPTYAGFARDEGRILSKQALSAIIDAKLEELLESIYFKLRDKGIHNQLGYGVVLTGGGAKLPGIDRMAKEVFSLHMAGRDVNVRIGRPYIDYETSEFFSPEVYSRSDFPNRLTGYSTPDHSTVMGFLYEENKRFWNRGSAPLRKSMFSKSIEMIKGWILGNF